jgi:BirA family biotin operon repressor/biotin-[acetyl-CoA-carboxylase] ligase
LKNKLIKKVLLHFVIYLKVVKLHTTESTNAYLKKWVSKNTAKNFMMVTADFQTNGRGQMGAVWFSDEGKNLIFSLFASIENFKIENQFKLNQAVSLGLLSVLKKYIPHVKIKWPNDIMADRKKIAGILIENTVSKNSIKHSIIGIGLNVNQTKFPIEIPEASSIKLITDKDYDLNVLLLEIGESIKCQILLLNESSQESFRKKYLDNLYLYRQESLFKDQKGNSFKGTIINIAPDGSLQIRLPDKTIRSFGFKEIGFL